MTDTPTTATGAALLASWTDWQDRERLEVAILAIEAEARAQGAAAEEFWRPRYEEMKQAAIEMRAEARAQVEDECVARGHLTGADIAAIRAQGAADERERIVEIVVRLASWSAAEAILDEVSA